MTQTVNGKFVSSLVAVLAIGLGPAIAEAQIPPSTSLLQPQGLKHTGIYSMRQIDPTLTGTGVKFAVVCRSFTYIDEKPQNDFRPAVEHECFKTRQFGFWEQALSPAGVSPHSTASCSILLGEDPDAFHPEIGRFYYQGAAPQAQADVYEFWHFLVKNVWSHTPPDADVIVASWGWQFEDWWTRGIESLVEHYGTIVVASIGNGGERHGPVLYPGAGANVIGVGVVDSVKTTDQLINLANFALAYPEHSSYGPTSTGRCKPDLVAPGNCLAADASEPNRYEPVGNWSSFSTPVVAGTVGLLLQKARQDPQLNAAASPEGGNCVIKAILLNSAAKLPYWHKGRLQTDDDHSAVLDYIQGAGMLNAAGAYSQLVAGMNGPGEVLSAGWDLNMLDKSETPQNSYTITLTEPADKVITITLVWNRHYANVSPFEAIPAKDSDLRLELWAIDPLNQANDYLLDYSDSSVDNVEHIYAAADPARSVYRIVLTFGENEIQESASNQRYGLAWNVSDRQPNDGIFWYDLNADGIVNGLDFAIVLDNLVNSATSSESYLLGDITADGSIDVRDLEDLFKHDNRRAAWYVEPVVKLR